MDINTDNIVTNPSTQEENSPSTSTAVNTSAQTSPIFTIPPELRNNIYELCVTARFYHDTFECIDCNHKWPRSFTEPAGESVFYVCRGLECRNVLYHLIHLIDDEPERPTKPTTRPAILSVCRQIREEAISIFYRANEFRFGERQLSEMTSFLKTVQSGHHKHLRHLSITVRPGCEEPYDFTLLKLLQANVGSRGIY